MKWKVISFGKKEIYNSTGYVHVCDIPNSHGLRLMPESVLLVWVKLREGTLGMVFVLRLRGINQYPGSLSESLISQEI